MFLVGEQAHGQQAGFLLGEPDRLSGQTTVRGAGAKVTAAAGHPQTPWGPFQCLCPVLQAQRSCMCPGQG